jgi:hypothetical protein
MEVEVNSKMICSPSQDVVVRDIQGGFIIIPIASGIGDLEDEIISLNETGKAVWGKLDGKKTLKEIAEELGRDYEGDVKEIEKAVLGIVQELVKRKVLVAAPSS